jgi:hypothetical protein
VPAGWKEAAMFDDNPRLGWTLVFLGLLIAGLGLLWVLSPYIPWLGRLPGDIRVERPNFRFYFPVVTCLLLSIFLTLIMYVVRLFRG